MFETFGTFRPKNAETAMTRKRFVFAGLVLASFFAVTALMATTLFSNGFGILKLFIFLCFLMTLPWTVIGFWNAVIGLLVMRLAKDPVAAVCPIEFPDENRPLTSSTALLSCVRDEDPDQLESNLSAMLANLVRSGRARNFTLYVLSDTSQQDIAAQERALSTRLADRFSGQIDIVYRRRPINSGFKAGNIQDFCRKWGDQHEFAIVLDADSYMSAEIFLKMVQCMEANPKLGILQSLVTGLPTTSLFARIFQFGMRLGMRSYTLGSAWWQGDCGPYWGHNAILRLKPFADHCQLPELSGQGPLSGTILSHDQVEAVLMRKAGFEVRVLPLETGSYEANPPHLLEFIRRDLRWCQGNMQYFKLIGQKGLKPVSRLQLVLAILMFLSSPAWIGFMTGAAILGLTSETMPFRADTGAILFVTILTMVFAPKLATVADVLLRPDLRSAFGGSIRTTTSTGAEILYSAMLAPIMAVAHTLFIGGLLFGKTIGWGAQNRGVTRLPLGVSLKKLWPQTLFGMAGLAWVSQQPIELVWPVIPVAAGPLLAVPIAILTSSEIAGRLGARSTLWRIPEETCPPDELAALELPALSRRPGAQVREADIVEGAAKTAEAV